jgi:hypothetical protein
MDLGQNYIEGDAGKPGLAGPPGLAVGNSTYTVFYEIAIVGVMQSG